MNKSISEYGCIYVQTPNNLSPKFTHAKVTKEQWNTLYDYWKESDTAKKIFDFDGYTLKAKNYVGVIQTENLSIEILPKIYIKNKEDEARTVFIEMLKPLLDINEVQINKASLSVTKNRNIYEMFITLFIEALDLLIHRGLKSDYILQEGNQFFLKGKLKFNHHIRENLIHKERFYVETDDYLQDRPANRLLKSTIELLLNRTNDFENKRHLRQQLFVFDAVQLSKNYELDFKKLDLHRGMEYYKLPIRFAELFLMHKSFTSMRGKDHVFALLFPMEKVFENYMEFVLNHSKNEMGIAEVQVNGGANEYLLSGAMGDDCTMARLQPDYLLKMKNGKDIVSDAKWKLLEAKAYESEGCTSVNFSSGDVYQIFSYLHYYDCRDTAYLFVPKVEGEDLDTKAFVFLKDKNPTRPSEKKRLQIITVDLKVLTQGSMQHQFKKDIFNEHQ